LLLIGWWLGCFVGHIDFGVGQNVDGFGCLALSRGW
jgi:hypothetical protein